MCLRIFYIVNPDRTSSITGAQIYVDIKTNRLMEFKYWDNGELFIFARSDDDKFYKYTGELWFDIDRCRRCHVK